MHSQVDLDGDVTPPGAFPVGAKLRLAGVGDNWDVPTIGGTIGADEEKAAATAARRRSWLRFSSPATRIGTGA